MYVANVSCANSASFAFELVLRMANGALLRLNIFKNPSNFFHFSFRFHFYQVFDCIVLKWRLQICCLLS